MTLVEYRENAEGFHFFQTSPRIRPKSSLDQGLVGEAYQSARKTLNLAELSQFPIAVPDRSEQDDIVQLADAVEIREKAENERLTELQNAKAALSQALLTGSVRVPRKGGD